MLLHEYMGGSQSSAITKLINDACDKAGLKEFSHEEAVQRYRDRKLTELNIVSPPAVISF